MTVAKYFVLETVQLNEHKRTRPAMEYDCRQIVYVRHRTTERVETGADHYGTRLPLNIWCVRHRKIERVETGADHYGI